jgi:hypothetical protein
MTSMTRGPLPPGVYWRRRALVIGLAVVLVMVFANLLGNGSDGSSDDDGVAEQAAGSPTSSPSEDPTRKQGGKKKNKPSPTPTITPMPDPTGPCLEDDILVQPVVERAVAGSDVTIGLELRTRTAEACTWQVSPSHLTLKVTSGSDDIWASQECPRAVPVEEVVVRQDFTTTIGVVWDGRRSEPGCRITDCPRSDACWALPGYYHVAAAPLGGEPAEVQFQLTAPVAQVITQSPKPNQNQNKNPGQNQNQNQNNPEANQGREN